MAGQQDRGGQEKGRSAGRVRMYRHPSDRSPTHSRGASHSLNWRGDNPHPALTTLRSYVGSAQPGHGAAGTWAPKRAQDSPATALRNQ